LKAQMLMAMVPMAQALTAQLLVLVLVQMVAC
jgi:hypothetical protein